MQVELSRRTIRITLISVALVLVVIAIMVRVFWHQFLYNQPVVAEVACEPDERMCSDGTLVYREGPTCSFAACPRAENGTSTEYLSWETYSNSTYGFSLSYPPFWDATEEGTGIVRFTSDTFAAAGPLVVSVDREYQATSSDLLWRTLIDEYDYKVTNVVRHEIGGRPAVEVFPVSHHDPSYKAYVIMDADTTLMFDGQNAHRAIVSTLNLLTPRE